MRPMHGTAGQMAGVVKSKRIPRIVGRERWKPATQSWRPWARRPVKDPEKNKLGRENTAIVNRTVTLSTVPPGNLDMALASPIPVSLLCKLCSAYSSQTTQRRTETQRRFFQSLLIRAKIVDPG